MHVALNDADSSAEPLLSRLLQLYVYDLSEVVPVGLDVGEDGCFSGGTSIQSCWQEPWRTASVIRVDAKIAGFCILDRRSRLTGSTAVSDVAEFFVLRRYRRHGVGLRAAHLAFDRVPGAWEVRQRTWNTAATRFWRRVIDEYTDGAFTEQRVDDHRWQGPVQTFGTPI